MEPEPTPTRARLYAEMTADAFDRIWGGPFAPSTYRRVMEWVASALRALLEGRFDAEQAEIVEVAMEGVAETCLAATGSPGCGSGARVSSPTEATRRRTAARCAGREAVRRLAGIVTDEVLELVVRAGPAIEPAFVAHCMARGAGTPALLAAVALGSASAGQRLPRRLRVDLGPLTAADAIASLGPWGDVVVGLAGTWEEGARDLGVVACELVPFGSAGSAGGTPAALRRAGDRPQ